MYNQSTRYNNSNKRNCGGSAPTVVFTATPLPGSSGNHFPVGGPKFKAGGQNQSIGSLSANGIPFAAVNGFVVSAPKKKSNGSSNPPNHQMRSGSSSNPTRAKSWSEVESSFQRKFCQGFSGSSAKKQHVNQSGGYHNGGRVNAGPNGISIQPQTPSGYHTGARVVVPDPVMGNGSINIASSPQPAMVPVGVQVGVPGVVPVGVPGVVPGVVPVGVPGVVPVGVPGVVPVGVSVLGDPSQGAPAYISYGNGPMTYFQN